jgi:hypothetical protein
MSNDTVPKKTCFVVMGFGEKTDFLANPQRVLNLDKTYRTIIKPAVEEAGLECIRADDIIHSGFIDKHMYEMLMNADVVVADLSTTNPNAIYELGVRHALRPHTTVVMAESNFTYPFDIKSISILKYEHLGKGIDAEEADKKKNELREKIRQITQMQEIDSPVYTLLPGLQQPALEATVASASQLRGVSPPPPSAQPSQQDGQSLSALRGSFEKCKSEAKKPSDWMKAIAFLEEMKSHQPNDPFIIQQLALATYKSEQPDALTSLHEAKTILEQLQPTTSSDAETIGLWGAIHKRLWERGKNRDDLDEAIKAYARGYYIKSDYYNGINYAFLLNVRAALGDQEDAIADRALAKRVRRDVLKLCDAQLASGSLKDDELFWVQATKVEALLGLGRAKEAADLRAETIKAAKPWMVEALDGQLAKLKLLLP